MRKRLSLLAVTAVAIVLAAACAGASAPGEVAGSYDQLVERLESEGSAVDAAGAISQPFFEPEGKVIRLAGQDVQVFEFATEGEAASAAEAISPDGSSIGTSLVTWVALPHFYQAGRLVVLYLGEDQNVTTALEGALGPQIAGR